jgi:hypothetical protein
MLLPFQQDRGREFYIHVWRVVLLTRLRARPFPRSHDDRQLGCSSHPSIRHMVTKVQSEPRKQHREIASRFSRWTVYTGVNWEDVCNTSQFTERNSATELHLQETILFRVQDFSYLNWSLKRKLTCKPRKEPDSSDVEGADSVVKERETEQERWAKLWCAG